MENALDVKFRISYVLLGLIFVIILGVAIFYYAYHQRGIEFGIMELMAYATGSVAILTLIYHSLSLESRHYFHRENLRIVKNQYSYEVVSKINNPEMARVLGILHELKRKKAEDLKEKNIKNFTKYLEEKPAKRTKLVMLLNYFEHMSLLVKNGHVDEKIIKSSFGTLFTSTYALLKFYIDERQTEHRRSWIEFEELAKKWRKQK